MKRGVISNFIRKTGLILWADNFRYQIEKLMSRKKNLDFKNEYPNVLLPPDYLIYESFRLDYRKYYVDGEETAGWLTQLLIRYINLDGVNILDWGCGPGRIIRHLSKFIGEDCTLYGTDYNKKSIEWCAQNLPSISFNNNRLNAVLPYADNFFDIIYGLSVFTHLSEPMHFHWYNELRRILKPDGIFLFTTQGDNFKTKLVKQELNIFEAGKIVVRGAVKEGHRSFSAFHPKKFIEELTGDDIVLEHIEQKPSSTGWLPQDIWIVRK